MATAFVCQNCKANLLIDLPNPFSPALCPHCRFPIHAGAIYSGPGPFQSGPGKLVIDDHHSPNQDNAVEPIDAAATDRAPAEEMTHIQPTIRYSIQPESEPGLVVPALAILGLAGLAMFTIVAILALLSLAPKNLFIIYGGSSSELFSEPIDFGALNYDLEPEEPEPSVEPTPFRETTQLDRGVFCRKGQIGIHISNIGGSDNVTALLPATDLPDRSTPCVFVAAQPEGILTGANFVPRDFEILYPLVQAGFIVIAYDIDGALPFYSWKANRLHYRNSECGLINARNAINFSLEQLPEIDVDRMFTLGIGTSGTQALLFAAYERRIKGCVALGAFYDKVAWVKSNNAPSLQRHLEVLQLSSPTRYASRFECPTFCFHSPNNPVPISQPEAFVEQMRSRGKNVKLVVNSELNGMSAAIEWLQERLETPQKNS